MCMRCNYATEEDLRHLLAECPQYEKERELFMNKMVLLLGEGEWKEISKKDNDEDLAFILGMTEDSSKAVMEETKHFIRAIWRVRQKL